MNKFANLVITESCHNSAILSITESLSNLRVLQFDDLDEDGEETSDFTMVFEKVGGYFQAV